MFHWGTKKPSEHDWICSLSTEERIKEYMKTARERWESCWMIQASEGWKIESGKNDIEGCVSAQHFKEFGKIHRIKGVVEAPWSAVFEQLVHGDNESPAWNPTVEECRTVEVLNDNTDIAYNIAREAAGGLVSRRDFVNLRHWKQKDGIMVSLGWSVPHPDMPPTKKHVRADNRPSFWTFEQHKEDSNKCHFALYTRIDLRGWLPHRLVEQATVSVLANYLVYLRTRMDYLKTRNNGIPPMIGNGKSPVNGNSPANEKSSETAEQHGDTVSTLKHSDEHKHNCKSDAVNGIISEMNTLNLKKNAS